MGFIQSIKEKVSGSLLSNKHDDYDYEEDYGPDEGDGYYDEDDEHVQMQRPTQSREPKRRSNVIQANPGRSSLGTKMNELGYNSGSKQISETVISHPKSIGDAVELCAHVRNGRMVIVDIAVLDKTEAQRVADYLSGVAQSLDGTIERVNNGIFAIAPRNHRVTVDYRGEDSDDSFPLVADR